MQENQNIGLGSGSQVLKIISSSYRLLWETIERVSRARNLGLQMDSEHV